MLNKKEPRKKRCSHCGSILEEEYKHYGCCMDCMATVYRETKIFLFQRSAVGAVLAALTVGIFYLLMSTVERGTIFNSPIYVYACTAIALCMFIMPFGVSDKFNAVQRIGLFKYASGLSDLKYSDVLDNSSRYQTSHSKRSIRMLDLILSIFIAPFVIVFTLYRLFVIYAYLLNN